jgi:hypothetical protein
MGSGMEMLHDASTTLVRIGKSGFDIHSVSANQGTIRDCMRRPLIYPVQIVRPVYQRRATPVRTSCVPRHNIPDEGRVGQSLYPSTLTFLEVVCVRGILLEDPSQSTPAEERTVFEERLEHTVALRESTLSTIEVPIQRGTEVQRLTKSTAYWSIDGFIVLRQDAVLRSCIIYLPKVGRRQKIQCHPARTRLPNRRDPSYSMIFPTVVLF